MSFGYSVSFGYLYTMYMCVDIHTKNPLLLVSLLLIDKDTVYCTKYRLRIKEETRIDHYYLNPWCSSSLESIYNLNCHVYFLLCYMWQVNEKG